MRPHPDFALRRPPRSADLGAFLLAPLAPEAAEEDFAVVTRSEAVLGGLFDGDWPRGLTLHENRIDLAWHEREFTLGRSFAWILRDREASYLGCLYIFPDPGERGRGEVVAWLAEGPDRLARLAAFRPLLVGWVLPWLPEGGGYAWRMNDRV